MRRACGSVSDARASFCPATSFGLRLARSTFSASISASCGAPFRSAPGSGAALVPRRLGALGTRRRVSIDLGFQGGDTRPRCRLRLVQTQRALVRALARRSLDLGAIDHDLVGVKKSLRHERCQRFGEQIVEHIGMRHPELRKLVVIDRHTARDPAIGQILAGQPVQLSRRADPVHRRQEPQRKQHSRVGGRPTRGALTRFDLVVKHRQIQRLDERRPPIAQGLHQDPRLREMQIAPLQTAEPCYVPARSSNVEANVSGSQSQAFETDLLVGLVVGARE